MSPCVSLHCTLSCLCRSSTNVFMSHSIVLYYVFNTSPCVSFLYSNARLSAINVSVCQSILYSLLQLAGPEIVTERKKMNEEKALYLHFSMMNNF